MTITRMVATIIQAVSPEFSVGASSTASSTTKTSCSATKTVSLVISKTSFDIPVCVKLSSIRLNNPTTPNFENIFFMMVSLKCILTSFTGADSLNLIKWHHKNLAITNFSSECRL